MSDHIERSEKRIETSLMGAIRLRDGTEIPCIVKNVSTHGARIGVPQSRLLPESFLFRINGRKFVCLARLAWRQGNYAGVRIERVAKLPEPATSAQPAS